MTLSQLLGFGKKRSAPRPSAKPSKKLLALCRRLGVKVTAMRGGKRVYKTAAVLKSQCEKKMMAKSRKNRGGLGSMVRKVTKKGKKAAMAGARVAKNEARAMAREELASALAFGRNSKFGALSSLNQNMGYEFCDQKKYSGGVLSGDSTGLFASPCRLRSAGFGKKRSSTKKPTRSARFGADMGVPMMAFGSYDLGVGSFSSFGRAVRAYRNYYGSAGKRRSGFGYSPDLTSMMGYEFCDPKKYRGGVLSEDSTGLFPSPCRLRESTVPVMAAGPAAGFGKKRRAVKKSAATKKVVSRPSAAVRRMCKKLGVKITLKRGSKRVYKSEKVLKAQCKKKMMMMKRKSPVKRRSRPVRKSMFGGLF